MKCISVYQIVCCNIVAPLAGAWIEIERTERHPEQLVVAPLAGAWIEIPNDVPMDGNIASLPSRERGLKFRQGQDGLLRYPVAPLAGAWIEMMYRLPQRSLL